MKNPEDWVKVYVNSPRYTVAMLVREVQKEAYNQAIDDLIEDDVVSNRAETMKKFKKL